VLRPALLLSAVVLLGAPSAAGAHEDGSHGPGARASVAEPCPGDPIAPTRVIRGDFGSELQGSQVLVPFDVPAGTTAVRVKYCHDQPEAPTSAVAGHTLDLGLYEPPRRPGALYGPAEFRGWGGSSHPDVTVSPQGFSSEEEYRERPRGHVPGRTTRGFLPGPARAGRWAVELGLAGIAGRELGDTDGRVSWRVEIELASDPAFARVPYVPAPYRSAPARRGAGWYAGDMHVHAEHSALGDATMTEVFDHAFRPRSRGGAGLDFVTLSDYVTSSAWGEIGRHQPRYPRNLIARSAEVITYRGHANNHASATYVDHRTGPIYERSDAGELTLRRPARGAAGIMHGIRRAGGFTQINHPTIFPSENPIFALLCRGCPWDFPPEETGYASVDAIEVATGPAGSLEQGPSPFVVTAIDFYERALAMGHRIAAVGSSDSHHAGRTPDPVTQRPVGSATTVVRAPELSEAGVQCGVEAGHTYVKLFGPGDPDLRLDATATGLAGRRAIMGDTLRAPAGDFTARVIGGERHQLLVMRNGRPFRTAPVVGGDFRFRFRAGEPGRYRLQLQRSSAIIGVTTPIWLERPAGGAGPGVVRRPCRGAGAATLGVRGLTGGRVAVRAGAFPARCRVTGATARGCRVSVRATPRGRPARTVGGGRITRPGAGTWRLQVRLDRSGRRLLARRPRGAPVTLVYTAPGPGGARARDRRAARLHRAAGGPVALTGARRTARAARR
jgi:hypothetical protein